MRNHATSLKTLLYCFIEQPHRGGFYVRNLSAPVFIVCCVPREALSPKERRNFLWHVRKPTVRAAARAAITAMRTSIPVGGAAATDPAEAAAANIAAVSTITDVPAGITAGVVLQTAANAAIRAGAAAAARNAAVRARCGAYADLSATAATAATGTTATIPTTRVPAAPAAMMAAAIAGTIVAAADRRRMAAVPAHALLPPHPLNWLRETAWL